MPELCTERIHHPDPSSFELGRVLRTLGDPLRLAMVRLLSEEGELPSGEIYDRLGLPASTGSHHTKLLREAGITRTRAVGTQRLISLRREDLESCFPGLVELIAGRS